jgi:hypothetical protein
MPKKKLWIEKLVTEDIGKPFIVPGGLTDNYHYGFNNFLVVSKYEYENYIKLKEAINSIEFSCFQKGGKCYGIPKTATCCCANCLYYAGHFGSSDILEEKNIPIYNDLFKSNTKTTSGFWVKGKGCSLPRDLRSLTCISYNCEKTDGDVNLSTTVRAMKEQLRSLSNEIKLRVSPLITREVIKIKMKEKGYKLTNKQSTKK